MMALWKTAAFTPEASGWIPPSDRTSEMRKADKAIQSDMPSVGEVFGGSSTSERPRIWEVVGKAIEKGLVPAEFVRGKHLKNISQIIGSCVGFGAGNMALYASVIDALIRGQRERVMVPFVPYHYGRGRLHSGIRGPGSGSFGSGQAKALAVDGFLAFDHENVPKPSFGEQIIWTGQIETQWSDGARIGDEFVQAGQKHLFPTAARVDSVDQAKTLLDSYYTMTIASSWGGQMRCPVRDGVLLNSRSGTWNHQMWVIDYITHPSLGDLFWVGNNWRYPHGTDPGGEWDNGYGAPPGGFYIRASDMAWIISKRETFAFADPAGFVDRSRKFQWITAK
ncbi:MAG: hypothetical protein WBC44_09445 [Planctomycetaceae bacterium]